MVSTLRLASERGRSVNRHKSLNRYMPEKLKAESESYDNDSYDNSESEKFDSERVKSQETESERSKSQNASESSQMFECKHCGEAQKMSEMRVVAKRAGSSLRSKAKSAERLSSAKKSLAALKIGATSERLRSQRRLANALKEKSESKSDSEENNAIRKKSAGLRKPISSFRRKAVASENSNDSKSESEQSAGQRRGASKRGLKAAAERRSSSKAAAAPNSAHVERLNQKLSEYAAHIKAADYQLSASERRKYAERLQRVKDSGALGKAVGALAPFERALAKAERRSERSATNRCSASLRSAYK